MRPRFRRRLGIQFDDTYFKPRGIPLRELNEVNITDEELETLRLRYMEHIDQEQAAKMMGISQSQYQRDITSVMGKITEALINGYAISIKRRN